MSAVTQLQKTKQHLMCTWEICPAHNNYTPLHLLLICNGPLVPVVVIIKTINSAMIIRTPVRTMLVVACKRQDWDWNIHRYSPSLILLSQSFGLNDFVLLITSVEALPNCVMSCFCGNNGQCAGTCLLI